ncbi:MAG: HAMP domain-containing histidine kinase [Lachnospiraceae bacterium]|nr:HAMP domain-containing histidine kinase [Lachnospiraceae bacterium]
MSQKKPVKVLLVLLQAAAVGGIVFCLFNIGFWMEDSWSLGELSQSYEESDLFYRQVEEILSNKIEGQDNARLLETDGELNRDRQIDIQSYDTVGNTVQDMNTTYLLGDLLDFYENGGWQALHDAITAASGEGSRDVGEVLAEQSGVLETITPVTGITLEECSHWYSDSSGYVEKMYTLLDEAVLDLYTRYTEYTTVQDESWSSEAPSNLLYYIENTSNGLVYTNISADSYEEAVTAAEADGEYTSLYEGERSFNIMVTNPERVLNTAASEWFLEKRFVATNEKVYVAVNLSYPVSDELCTWADYYAQRETIIRNSAIGAGLFLVLLVLCFISSMAGAGTELLWIDTIPTELAAGIYLIIAILYLLLASEWKQAAAVFSGQEKALGAAAAASAWLVFLSACLGFLRRAHAKTLWTNSVTRTLIRTWKQINSSRAASGQLLFFYIGFFILNIFFLLLFGRIGLVLVILLDMAVLLYLLRDMAGKQSIYEGIHQLSQGDMNYRIDTSTLSGESLKMAEAVNEMGESLSKAMEAIVKNERLKAELITNVSHDLKTPLTSIVNYVDLLKRENLQNPRAREYVGILEQKSQRLKQLTEDLVEASKISSGNVELEIVRMQAQSILMQACGEFEERLEEHHLAFSWDMERKPIYLMADGRQLWRVLENLLGNICKYAKENTQVQVVLKRAASDIPKADNQMPAAEEVMIMLQNVSREKLTVEADELTSRFVRGDESRSTEGSGLGLSIAQNLTELLDGRFELSTQDGLFTVRLYFPIVE